MKVLLSSEDIRRSLTRITHEILENNQDINNVVLVGLKTRGEYLMERIASNILNFEKIKVDTLALNIDFWRDDLKKSDVKPEIAYNFLNKKVIIVDDVLFSGRTVRAAMDAIISKGRPTTIQLAVLIDRGHREFPIRADYVGKNIPTSKHENVKVNLSEIDSEDQVIII
ncbi:MAG TPA: bifunctional pyr operon transcriptional regulator/uracil phosphoribosyltransferase PyrR [Erysipelotrichaceae bacterium]|nr:bifunctional pyr operon transcriptional regulator/uracil phosphoribosyltransferase PyrR [Erysipelotrichaceae bacterium]